MLFKTLDEIKKYAEPSTSVKINTFTPSIAAAENKFIIPTIGKPLYDRINDKYNADPVTLSDNEKALLAKIQEPLASLALYLFVPRAEVQVSDGGVRRAETNDLKTAYKNQVQNLRESYIDAGFDAMERLLAYLEENKANFVEWNNGEQRKKMNSLLIRSGTEFQYYYSNLRQPQRTFSALLSCIAEVEDLMIVTSLGTTFTDLKTRQVANALTDNDKILIEYLKKAIANFTIGRGITDMQLRIDATGTTVMSNNADSTLNEDSKRTAANVLQLGALADKCMGTGNQYIKLAIDFLNSKATAEVYTVWYNAHKDNSSAVDINCGSDGAYSL